MASVVFWVRVRKRLACEVCSVASLDSCWIWRCLYTVGAARVVKARYRAISVSLKACACCQNRLITPSQRPFKASGITAVA